MTDGRAIDREAEAAFPRVIGAHERRAPGPLVLCVGGIHGNEPAGVHAARRVLEALAESRPSFRGRFVALSGNRRALALGRRFVDVDLNRAWLPRRIEALRAGEARGDAVAAEDAEQREILAVLEEELGRTTQRAYFLDLHTSSADGPPFVTVGDTLANRAFAFRLALPVVLGLEEQIDGALLEYIGDRGHVTVGVEGGRHDAPDAVDLHEAVIWLALVAADCIDEAEVPSLEGHRRRLREATPGIPRVLEVRRRHRVEDEDGFLMRPGFSNFDELEDGQVIAEDRMGAIHARERGRVLLPLYQGQGDDGFFTVREIRAVWLHLSQLLRRWRASRLGTLLPGVRRHPRLAETFVIDTRVARFFPLQVLHLLGFRKRRWQGDVLLVSRRSHDPR